MKKLIATLIVIGFFATGCTPSAMRLAALGTVMGGVTVLGIGSALTNRSVANTDITARRDVKIEYIKANTASGAKISCGDEPCENSYESSTAGSAVVRHMPMPIAQPIAQYVRPLVSHKNASRENSNGGESDLCREGRRAAQLGINADAACASVQDDYCRCYRAARR